MDANLLPLLSTSIIVKSLNQYPLNPSSSSLDSFSFFSREKAKMIFSSFSSPFTSTLFYLMGNDTIQWLGKWYNTMACVCDTNQTKPHTYLTKGIKLVTQPKHSTQPKHFSL